ncbi:MAG: ADP-ribosylglycohydrolase family protein [Clostridia bacterium]|nr:ADP-ribosylglycohydrolase family protein [Clostridia bacterium]
MWGAIIGDIVGSIYEFDNIRTKEFKLFSSDCFFTDDTVMTVAVAKSLLDSDGDYDAFARNTVDNLHIFGRKYPNAGYGGRFRVWLNDGDTYPYNSFGNGSAMRVSACGFAARTLEEAVQLAYNSAYCTHNHFEGIRGACAAAVAIFLAGNGKSKEEIKEYICKYYYEIDFTLDEIRDTYSFNETCQETVPQALEAFFESDDFEDAIRNAISIGGDSDTLAAITGGVAQAYYGIPDEIIAQARTYLDDFLLETVDRFNEKYMK